MVTSSPIALALGLEHASADIMNHPPREKGKSSLWTLEFVFDNFVYGILIGMQSLSSFIICLNVGGGVGRTMYNIPGGCNHPGFNENCNYVYVARAVTFYSHSLLLLFHGLNCRHQRQSIYTKGRPTNKWLWMAIAIGLAMVIPTAYLGDASEIAFTQREFGWQWGIVLANVVIFLMLSELYKFIKRRFW